MSVSSGDARPVPRRQQEPMRDRIDNYRWQNQYWGKPYLTDETDIFDRIHREDRRINREDINRYSIQRWRGRA